MYINPMSSYDRGSLLNVRSGQDILFGGNMFGGDLNLNTQNPGNFSMVNNNIYGKLTQNSNTGGSVNISNNNVDIFAQMLGQMYANSNPYGQSLGGYLGNGYGQQTQQYPSYASYQPPVYQQPVYEQPTPSIYNAPSYNISTPNYPSYQTAQPISLPPLNPYSFLNGFAAAGATGLHTNSHAVVNQSGSAASATGTGAIFGQGGYGNDYGRGYGNGYGGGYGNNMIGVIPSSAYAIAGGAAPISTLPPTYQPPAAPYLPVNSNPYTTANAFGGQYTNALAQGGLAYA